MDLNYILAREQVSIFRSEATQCQSARHAHSALALAYGALIVARGFPHNPYLTERSN